VSVYHDRIYPYLVSRLGDPKPIRELRRRIIPLARGTVLEVGSGWGANLPYDVPARVTKLYALEPNARMIVLAEPQRPPDLSVEYVQLPGERIPLQDGSVDSVVIRSRLGRFPVFILHSSEWDASCDRQGS
jgi:hypothetical protein